MRRCSSGKGSVAARGPVLILAGKPGSPVPPEGRPGTARRSLPSNGKPQILLQPNSFATVPCPPEKQLVRNRILTFLALALALALAPYAQPATAQDWERHARAGTISRSATVEGLEGRYRSARAELTLTCSRAGRARVAMILYHGPVDILPAGMAIVDNGPMRAVTVETRTDALGSITVALLEPSALRQAMRAGLRLTVAVDSPGLREAVAMRVSLAGFTRHEETVC